MPGLAGKGWGIKIFKNTNLYWIDAAHSLGNIFQLKIYIGVGYIMPTMGKMLECFCAPFVHGVVKYTISRIYNQLKIYGDIGYIMPTLGDECNLEIFCEPFWRRVGKYSIKRIYIS